MSVVAVVGTSGAGAERACVMSGALSGEQLKHFVVWNCLVCGPGSSSFLYIEKRGELLSSLVSEIDGTLGGGWGLSA